MPYSNRWEEPLNNCIGCVPFPVLWSALVDSSILAYEPVKECLQDHNKYTGKCPYCHQILPKPKPETDWSSPNIILTFECVECLKEFDCNTISFKVLCDSAIAAGWKMDWYDQGYSTTCKECLK